MLDQHQKQCPVRHALATVTTRHCACEAILSAFNHEATFLGQSWETPLHGATLCPVLSIVTSNLGLSCESALEHRVSQTKKTKQVPHQVNAIAAQTLISISIIQWNFKTQRSQSDGTTRGVLWTA